MINDWRLLNPELVLFLRLCFLVYMVIVVWSPRARRRVASVCEKVANQRQDYAYKTARSIVDRYERVYVEDLNVQGMMRNRRLSKSLGDAGWGMLRNALTYMAERSEGVTAFVSPRGTSQTCSGCGAYVKKDLSMRVHGCPGCGLTIDRDVNAALNVLKRGLEIGLERAEYTPVGEATPTRLSEAGQVVSASSGREPRRSQTSVS